MHAIRQWEGHWITRTSARIGSGATLVGAANAFSNLSLFAVSVIIGRLTGPANLGRYSLLIVVGSFFGGIVDFGADRVLTERLAQAQPSWTSSLRTIGVLKGGTICLGLAAGVLWLRIGHVDSLLLISIQAASVTANLTVLAVASALRLLRSMATARLASRLTAVAGIGLLIAVNHSADNVVKSSIVLVAVADLVAATALTVFIFRPSLTKLDRVRRREESIWETLKVGAPLGVSSLAVWLYLKLDTVIVAAVSDLATLGSYTAAVRIAELLGGFPSALNSVALTSLAELWSTNRRRFQITRDFLLAGTTLGMGFACLIVFLLAVPIATSIYHLPGAGSYLRPLVWGQVFAAAGVISGAALQVSRRSNAVAHIAVIVAIASIPTYMFLALSFGAFGAALGTTALYTAILPIGLAIRSSRETFLPLLKASGALLLGLLAAFTVMAGARRAAELPGFLEITLPLVAYTVVATSTLVVIYRRGLRLAARTKE